MAGKSDAKEVIYRYLKSQNRPYSANDVTQNLHNEFGKTVVQKALDDLTRENRINEKVYGKQKIYCVVQDEDVSVGDMETEMMNLDSEIEQIILKLKTAESELKANENALKDLKKQPTREQCIREKEELEKDIETLTKKVESLSKSGVNVSENDRNKIHKDSEIYVKEYKKRKRICMEILNSILENCPKPKKALLEEIGIETDEDVSFKL